MQATKTNGTSGALPDGPGVRDHIHGGEGEKVSFASMFGESNDWFFAPGPDGIALYDAQGNPVSGDVTSQVSLWNAGTEIDQEPGVGDSVGPNQSAPDFGVPDTDATVRLLGATTMLADGSSFTLPAIAA